MLVKVYNYSEGNEHELLSANLKTWCKMKIINNNFNGSCSRLGKVSGRVQKRGDRFAIRAENDVGKFAIFTEYTEARARREF